MRATDRIDIYFSDYFEVPAETLEDYGAFDISLINDLPLFIDPFLLFNSKNPEYQTLHENMISYLRFLRDKALVGGINDGLLRAWFMFSEVKQTWLGFSRVGNSGSGLGLDFARALHDNLHTVFSDFGHEKVTRGSHLEKLCLISAGVGRDNISDFTTNLIKEYLLTYTQAFARETIHKRHRAQVTVPKVRFNYQTQTWQSDRFELPYFNNQYVVLTPIDILTKDDTWINRRDLVDDYPQIAAAVPNEQLRAQLDHYFASRLGRNQTNKERDATIAGAYSAYPELLEYYIRYKEDNGDRAKAISAEKVAESQRFYIEQIRILVQELNRLTGFYHIAGNSYEEAHARAMFLKDVVENKDGYRLFYANGKPIKKEEDLHILYRLTWYASPYDVNQEVNNGRGPADYAVSMGSGDKSLVEFKLASNTKLRQNLEHQVAIYEKASGAQKSLKVIFFFTQEERVRVDAILKALKLTGKPDIILVDARRDNKPSASNTTTGGLS